MQYADGVKIVFIELSLKCFLKAELSKWFHVLSRKSCFYKELHIHIYTIYFLDVAFALYSTVHISAASNTIKKILISKRKRASKVNLMN
jgi:hypothetical protein